VALDVEYSPFEVLIPGSPPHRHAALAARLRNAGWSLAVTQSDRVTGLTCTALELADLDEGPEVLLVVGERTPREELGEARADLALTVEQARQDGVAGRIAAADWLLETMVGRSPRLAARLRKQVLGPLDGQERGQLERTLRTLMECGLDRTATSAALQIHRNTLTYRLERIQTITGLDLSSPHDLASVHVALRTPRKGTD